MNLKFFFFSLLFFLAIIPRKNGCPLVTLSHNTGVFRSVLPLVCTSDYKSTYA